MLPNTMIKEFSEKSGKLRSKQLSDLAKLLADILTVSNGEARSLLKQYPADVKGLYEALLYAPNVSVDAGGLSELVSKKWRGQTMMLLPKAWVVPHVGEDPEAMLIEDEDLNKRASLRHVSFTQLNFGDKHDPTSDRVILLKTLREKLPQALKARYGSFLTLMDETDLPYSRIRTAHYPHGNDLQLLIAVDWIEHRFEDERRNAEERSRQGVSPMDATPAHVRRTLGKIASARVLEKLRKNIEQQPLSSNRRPCPGGLILRVLCNAVVNRQLLERAHQHELTSVAWDANVRFLKAMGCAGIRELDVFELSGRSPAWNPLFRNSRDVDEVGDWPIEDYIESLDGRSLGKCTGAGLQALFGPESRWVKVAGNSPLREYDQRWVIRLSSQVVDHYVRTRGNGSNVRYIHWAMAVMAVMACWFSATASVPHLVAASNRRQSAFPGKNVPDDWRPTAAHLALYAIMTGQLIFGNSGLELSAAAVDEYFESNKSVHASGQGVIFHSFKCLPLLSLLDFLEKMDAHIQAPEMADKWRSSC